jgi:hypothetical protein
VNIRFPGETQQTHGLVQDEGVAGLVGILRKTGGAAQIARHNFGSLGHQNG